MTCKYRKSHGSHPFNAGDGKAHAFGEKLHRFFKRLHRNPDQGKIAGVCAGVAETAGMRPWIVRAALIILLIMNAPVAILLYILGVVLLERRTDFAAAAPEAAGPTAAASTKGPSPEGPQSSGGSDAAADTGLPQNLRFESLRRKFKDLEERAGDMEAHVTSGDYTLNKRFKEI